MSIELYGRDIEIPVSIEPRIGKYYGTHILDAKGREVVELWIVDGEPSEREKARFGPYWSPEAWSEYRNDGLCDHWESDAAYKAALSLVELLNAYA